MADEQILARGQEAMENGCTELHLVGGLHHQKKFDWYRDMIRLLHDTFRGCISKPGRRSKSTGLSF